MKKTSSAYNLAFQNALRGRDLQNAALNEGIDGEGQYVIPMEFKARLEASLAEKNLFRKFGTVLELPSSTGKVLATASTGEAEWTPEDVAFTESSDTVTKFAVGAHKLSATSRLKMDFVADTGFPLAEYLCTDFAHRFGRTEEAACIGGDGITQPTGILHETEGGQVGIMTGLPDEITHDSLLGLYFSLEAEYRENAVFLMHDSIAMYLRTIKDDEGNLLWRAHDDIFFGKRVFTSPHMPIMDNGAKVIVFGDLSYYWLVERQPLTIQRYKELYALEGHIGYSGYERLDGRLIRPEAVKILQMKA